jgi:putative PIN family toxin of toxin-antitoxin system
MKKRIGIDCNIFGSVLLGGKTRERFIELLKLRNSGLVKIYYCDELILEIEKLATVKYFIKKGITEAIIAEFVSFLKSRSKRITLKSLIELNRDKKDNYLLSLSVDGKLHYLVTGDKDLLVMERIGNTEILTLVDFLTSINEYPF